EGGSPWRAREIDGVEAALAVEHHAAGPADEDVVPLAADENVEARHRIGAAPAVLHGAGGEIDGVGIDGVGIIDGVEPAPALIEMVAGRGDDGVVAGPAEHLEDIAGKA